MAPRIIALFILGVCTCGPSFGQIPELAETFAYRYALPGRTTIDVYVWGAVGRPGVWKISSNVDLLELLSVAQVPGVGQDEASIQQNVLLQVYRVQDGSRKSVYRESLDRILESGREYPPLQNGDIVEVVSQKRKRIGFQSVVQVLAAGASLSLLVLRLARGN